MHLENLIVFKLYVVFCYTHFNFYSRLEANAIWNGCLKVSNGVIFLLYLWGHWRFRQVYSSWLELETGQKLSTS